MNTRGETGGLPQALTATALILVLPAAAVWALATEGLVTSLPTLLSIGVAISLAIAVAGHSYWQRRGGHGDQTFAELMLWSWITRRRSQRVIADAGSLAGMGWSLAAEMDPERRVELLRRLADALDARDPYTSGHSRRVARYSAMIARGLGLPDEDVARVRLAAAVHDVGKLETPLEILDKPGKLSGDEYEIVKRHAARGAELVAGLGDPELTAMVAHHHERLDGAGYPAGLSGAVIPIGARIIAVADTFDAITSTRCYRKSRPHRIALRVLRQEAGSQLDPDAVRVFCRRYSGLRPLIAGSAAAQAIPRAVQPIVTKVGAAGAGAAGTASSAAGAAAVAASVAALAAGGPAGASPDPTRSADSRTLRGATVVSPAPDRPGRGRASRPEASEDSRPEPPRGDGGAVESQPPAGDDPLPPLPDPPVTPPVADPAPGSGSGLPVRADPDAVVDALGVGDAVPDLPEVDVEIPVPDVSELPTAALSALP